MKLEPGKLIAGRWRIVSELYSDDEHPRFRVSSAEAEAAEMIIVDDAARLKELLPVLKNISHGNFIASHEAGTWLDTGYYVRELVTMESLKSWFRRNKPLEEEQATAIACQLALVISELEVRKIAFCGLSMENVCITIDGVIKVDPLAAWLEGASHPEAPEEATEAQADIRAEVFRTGLILASLLFEEQEAAEGKSFIERLHDEEKASHISPALKGVLEKMLAARPGDRYLSGDELLNDLNKVLAIGSQQQIFSDEPEETKWHEDKRFWLYTAYVLGGLLVLMLIIQNFFLK